MNPEQQRKEISLEATTMDLLVLMAEGNPGAITILAPLFKEDPLRVLDLDDMNIRGTQIWVGYKDHCGCDLKKFAECVKNRDPAMVEAINNVGRQGNHPWKAVPSGASYSRGKRPRL